MVAWKTAYVHIWGELAGAVAWDDSTGVASFEFDNAFKRNGWDLSPLKMPITSRESIFSFPELRKKANTELDCFKRRMVFNVLSRNCDDHTRNFSFRLKRDNKWELAPAYDLCHYYRPDSDWVSQHALSINGKRTGITRNDLMILAESVNIKKAAQIIEQVHSVVSRWTEYADSANVRPKLRDTIEKTLIHL